MLRIECLDEDDIETLKARKELLIHNNGTKYVHLFRNATIFGDPRSKTYYFLSYYENLAATNSILLEQLQFISCE